MPLNGTISDNIEAVWEIMKSDNPEFPFTLVRSGPLIAPMGFPCRTEDEAKGKLLQLALEYDRLGHKMTLA